MCTYCELTHPSFFILSYEYQSSYKSVKYMQLLAKFMFHCLIYQQTQLEQPYFVQLWINFSIYALNVISTTALTCELKPFEAPVLPTDDPRFSWRKHQVLKYFEGWLTKVEVRPGVYVKV